ncbi:MAG TPA: hypothetical protein DD396_06315 [Bacteroidetes bacterium]|nr:hypothetical protein [Bacteroidota bacterium]
MFSGFFGVFLDTPSSIPATLLHLLLSHTSPLTFAYVIRIKGVSASYVLPALNKKPYKHLNIRYL